MYLICLQIINRNSLASLCTFLCTHKNICRYFCCGFTNNGACTQYSVTLLCVCLEKSLLVFTSMWCLLLALHLSRTHLVREKLSKDFRDEILPTYCNSLHLSLASQSHNLLDKRYLRGKVFGYLATTIVIIISDNLCCIKASLIFTPWFSVYLPTFLPTYLFYIFAFCLSNTISLTYISLFTYLQISYFKR